MTKSQLNAICEVLINIRFGNIPVNEKDIKKLQRKKNAIVQLTSKTTAANIRKTLIEKEVALILMIIKSILLQDQVTCVMATEFILIPKHKYDQLQKDASTTVKDLPITTPSTNITSVTTSDVK